MTKEKGRQNFLEVVCKNNIEIQVTFGETSKNRNFGR